MRIVAYARVSTVRQAVEGCSLEAQESRLRAFAEANGHELVALEVDHGLSGKSMAKRPALGRALALIKAGMADALVITALSRLSRSSLDLALMLDQYFPPPGKAKRRSARLVSLNEGFDSSTPSGRMMVTMIGAVAQMERELTSERCAEAAAFNKARGQCVGTAPLGWHAVGKPGDKNRVLVVDPAEMAIVQRIKRERLEQRRTLQAIADDLNAEGIATRCGGTWAPAQIRKAGMSPDAPAVAVAA